MRGSRANAAPDAVRTNASARDARAIFRVNMGTWAFSPNAYGASTVIASRMPSCVPSYAAARCRLRRRATAARNVWRSEVLRHVDHAERRLEGHAGRRDHEEDVHVECG